MFEVEVTVHKPLLTAAALERRLAEGIDRAGNTVLARVLSVYDANVRSRTGRTRKTFRKILTVKPGDIRLSIRSKSGIARLLEHGVAPHAIAPKRKRLLSFVVDGRRVLARHVEHPGLRARRFFAAATDASTEAVQGSLRTAVNTAIAEAPIQTSTVKS